MDVFTYPETKSRHDANFIVAGGTTACHEQLAVLLTTTKLASWRLSVSSGVYRGVVFPNILSNFEENPEMRAKCTDGVSFAGYTASLWFIHI